jgi:YbgC/YbaW family acyl-CoA thioester hydrolase
VQFAETDLAGVVHFSWFLRYIEEAEHALWREAGLTIAPSDRALGFPRVSFQIDYHAPLHFEDVFDVWIRLTGMSTRTLSYASTITRGETLVATASHTAVCVDPRTRPLRATALPPEIRARLERYLVPRPL